MNDLLTPKFEGEFEITLNYPLWITENPFKLKEETKRAILEIIDSYGKVSLGYSGGSDSGFVLCCIHDLIDEGKITKNTIEIWQGIFIIDGNPQLDSERATRFANSLGFEPRMCEFIIDNAFNKKLMDYALKYVDRHQSMTGEDPYICLIQDYVASIQDSTVLTVSNTGTSLGFGWNPKDEVNLSRWSENWLISLYQVTHYDSDSNTVEALCWDNKVFSCLISPFKIKKRLVDIEPFEKLPESYDPLHPRNTNKFMDKWMIYLQCYPKMFEIFYKFSTFRNGWRSSNQKEAEMVREAAATLEKFPVKRTKVKLSNGKYFTIKDLLNYEEYFDVP
tara:strand:+ start:707 stop:1708 length:1002 start_codon:yes stop_codon:yes gene_type:complete